MPEKKDKIVRKSWFSQKFSPTFILMLVLSTMMWYLTKLGHTYTAQVPITVEVDGNRFSVNCIAEGSGYRLVYTRYFRNKPIQLNFRDLDTSPSVINAGQYNINTYSLQNAISVRTSDLTIRSVGETPEIPGPNTLF